MLQHRRAVTSSFIGTWRVRRKIFDYLTAKAARFEGVATITSDRFEEKGTLDWGATITQATRVYRLKFAAHEVAVRFPDDADFVTLHADAAQRVRHECGADCYRGRFFFRDPDHWVEAWRVSGPRKRYASLSRYSRLP